MDYTWASSPISKIQSLFGDRRIYYNRAPSDEYGQNEKPVEAGQRPWVVPWLWTCIVLLMLSASFNIYALVHWRQMTDLNLTCSTYTSRHKSPISDGVDIKYDTVRFNGSFFKETIYRQTPSPEVDQAWNDLGANFELIRIPEDRADDFGISRGQAKIPQRLGGGYPVSVETFHHLHCLNLLRKSTWFNYDYYDDLGEEAFTNSKKILQLHVGHCIDILRQQIMCTADINVFGQWWIEDVGPFVDFNTQHTCKNFEDIRDWTKQRLLSGKVEVERRAGDVILPEIP